MWNRKRFDFRRLWLRIWGNEVPPAEDLFPDDLYAYSNPEYLKMVRKQNFRRFFVILVICILGINLITTIKNTPFIACMGKEVCITRGPKLNYPTYWVSATYLDNGRVLLRGGEKGYNYTYHKYTRFLPRTFLRIFVTNATNNKIHMERIINSFDKIVSKLFGGPYGRTVELYIPKLNKFVKITEHPEFWKNYIFYKVGNNILIYPEYNDKLPILFDSETKTFEQLDGGLGRDNVWQQLKRELNTVVPLRVNYPGDKLLLLTQYNDVGWMSSRNDIKLKEKLVLLDLKTLKYEILPDFAIKPKYYPHYQDFNILDNGKIILPIRDVYCEQTGIFSERCTKKYDHTEIYDPISKKFSVETANVLEDNIFVVDLPDGNILFINEKTSYVFNNKTNQFENVTNEEEKKYKNVVAEIKKLFQTQFGANLYTRSKKKNYKLLKLDKDKFLITCPNGYGWEMSIACKNTIYYNHTSGVVRKGPKFLYPHTYSAIGNIDEDKFMVIGGKMRHPWYADEGYYRKKLPNEYTQIIRVKK